MKKSNKKEIYLKLLNESLNSNDNVELNKIKELLLRSERSEENISKSISNITDILEDSGYYPVGEGSFRRVYSKDNINFVIKVALSKQGIESNNKEIVVSQPSHRSTSVKNILPKLYEYDRRYDPLWITCEKVKPIRTASYEEIIKVFPTFFKALESDFWFDRTNDNDKKKILIELIEDIYLYIVNNNVTNISEIVEKIFKNFIAPRGAAQKLIKTGKFLDIDHFINSTSYDYTSDIYLRNLAIRNSGNPSPEDFVILDFDTRFQRKKSSSYHNPGFISLSGDSDLTEAVYKRLMIESLKQKRKYSGSHPDETYRYGWPEFDDAWFDADGKTTWDEDREWTKQYLKSIGLL